MNSCNLDNHDYSSKITGLIPREHVLIKCTAIKVWESVSNEKKKRVLSVSVKCLCTGYGEIWCLWRSSVISDISLSSYKNMLEYIVCNNYKSLCFAHKCCLCNSLGSFQAFNCHSFHRFFVHLWLSGDEILILLYLTISGEAV